MNFYKQMCDFGAQFDYPRLQRVCVAAVTYQGDGSDPATWDLSPFADGTHYMGVEVLKFLAIHKVVILQHWNRNVARLLRDRGVTVLLWVALEAIEGSSWGGRDQLQNELRDALMPYRWMVGGEPVNVYEGQSRTAAWAVDVGRVPMELVSGVLSQVDWADGFMIDSMIRYQYFGTYRWVTAPSPYSVDREVYWYKLVAFLKVRCPQFVYWGNTVDVGPRWGLDVAFLELFFHVRLLADAIVGVRERDCVNVSMHTVVSEEWPLFSHGIALRGIRDVYVCTAWTGQHNINPRWR